MKASALRILPIAVAAFVWLLSASAQVENKSSNAEFHSSPVASCFEKATGRLVGSQKLRTPLLISPDGQFRAYAETEAIAYDYSDPASHGHSECENTSRLFVAGPKSQKFQLVLEVKPSLQELWNSLDVVDWSPIGHHLLLAQGFGQWGSDWGGILVRTYDADTGTLSSETLVDDAFGKRFGKDCAATFEPIGFSSSGKIIVKTGPYYEEGEDQPEKNSCVKKEGLWLVNAAENTISKLPANFKHRRYAKVATQQ